LGKVTWIVVQTSHAPRIGAGLVYSTAQPRFGQLDAIRLEQLLEVVQVRQIANGVDDRWTEG
jgi:hypothetical protein